MGVCVFLVAGYPVQVEPKESKRKAQPVLGGVPIVTHTPDLGPTPGFTTQTFESTQYIYIYIHL